MDQWIPHRYMGKKIIKLKEALKIWIKYKLVDVGHSKN